MTVREIARIEVPAGQEAGFEAGFKQARPLFERAAGCLGASLHRGIENPRRYLLVVEWETVEHHTVQFRESADFGRWRELVGGYFATTPQVEHVTEV